MVIGLEKAMERPSVRLMPAVFRVGSAVAMAGVALMVIANLKMRLLVTGAGLLLRLMMLVVSMAIA